MGNKSGVIVRESVPPIFAATDDEPMEDFTLTHFSCSCLSSGAADTALA
jgi:hypothetical protein